MKIQSRNGVKITILVLGIIVIVLAAIGVWWLVISSKPAEQPQSSQQTSPKPAVADIQTKLLFTGNSFWGRYTNDAAKKTADPHAFPFARLSEFDRQKYDAWITGLECPTTKKGAAMTSAQMEATLTFNCDPAYLPEFAKWFTAVSLANNHTDNMGADGFTETQQALEQHGVQYLGHYDPEQLDDLCEVIALPVRAKLDDSSERSGKLPVAVCGYHFVFKLPQAASIAKISEYAQVMPTIVMPHGGAEYKPAPDQIKTDLYRSMIDAGADMVVGDHPHWVQTTEAYKGKLIVYSMGNFMFDQQFNAEVTRSAAISVEAKTAGASGELLEKWLHLGDSCSTYHDTCLAQAKQQGLERLRFEYRFGAIATDNKGYQTHPAPELQSAVEQRLRWAETMRALGQS